ncbi:MAG: LptE family protein [Desulfobacterales bacterium]|jgi:hypothetical protein|nr:LptE family protein [Desulfobacterales bacterium]
MNNVSSETGRILKAFHFLPYLFMLFLIVVLLSSCGYTNPYARNNSKDTYTKTLFITIWQNRTNELGLESEYFRLFNAWFKNSGRIAVVFDEDDADLKLIGEISSIDLPGLFYTSSDGALEIKIKLTVSFTLYNTTNNSILWQEKQYVIYEPFLLDPTGEETQYNKKRALLRIGDEIGEIIYLRTHEIVNNLP